MDIRKKLPDRDTNIVIFLAALLLLLVGALAAAFLLPPNVPAPVMPEGDVQIYLDKNGTLDVCWPELPEGCVCHVSVKNAVGVPEEDHILLSPQQYHEPLEIRLSAVAEGKNLLGVTRKTESENVLEITLDLAELTAAQAVQAPEVTALFPEAGTLELDWTGREGVPYEVYRVEEDQYEPVKSVPAEDASAVLRFGGDGDLELPGYNQPVDIVLRWVEQREGYLLYGPLSEPVRAARGDLLGSELTVNCTETGERMYILQWNETRGDYYEVQKWNRDFNRWDTVWQVDAGGELAYETGRLGSGADCRYQVAAYEQASAAAIPALAAGPEEISFRTSFSTLYATIWPILDQPLYSGTAQAQVIATIPGGTALCVLEETDGYFYVRYQDSYGYVDSRFCMINLPEYVGDLCAYDITNSYQSVFRVHTYPIDQITGQVIKGFEYVKQADGGYLVPFLYPSAQKLIKAAEAAGKDGCRLKIYEAYRPNEATRFLYQTTSALLDTPVPSIPSGADGEGESSASMITYRNVMTDDVFGIGSFLAASVSNHNRGVALDLTLETLEDGRELEMQSAIHDLSWYSITSRNNDNAKLLEKYMKDIGGMTGLSSEWWHFQDDEIRDELNLTGYLTTGVSAEGWTKDDVGWRYRKADGSVYRGSSLTVDGKRYSVNTDGYIME